MWLGSRVRVLLAVFLNKKKPPNFFDGFERKTRLELANPHGFALCDFCLTPASASLQLPLRGWGREFECCLLCF